MPPIGSVRLASGAWAIDPDEPVPTTVRRILDQFDREATWHGRLRSLVPHGVLIPVRPRGGPNRGELEWRRPNRQTLSNLRHHPSDAGASRFGHRPVDPRRKPPGRPTTGTRIRRPEECLVLIRDRLPASITWDRFWANPERLEANRARQDRHGAPRQGASLRAGRLRCGRCGRRMIVRDSGPKDRHASPGPRGPADYAEPLCQGRSGPVLDGLIAGRVLAAVEPAALEASWAAVAEVERERSERTRHRQRRRERAPSEVAGAARPYQACEPEDRPVGRELERRWEEALKSQRPLEDELARWQRSAPGRLSPDDERMIRSRASDLPAVGPAATTPAAERQRIARPLIHQVAVGVDKARERGDVERHRVGGLSEWPTLSRPVKRYDPQADYPRLIARLRAWCAAGLGAAGIAARLNAEGFRPPKRAERFTRGMVQRLSWPLGLARREPPGRRSGLGRDEDRPGGRARRLEIARGTVRRWLRAGRLTSHRDAAGHPVIWADASELRRLRELHRLPRTWATTGRLAELTKPKPGPGR